MRFELPPRGSLVRINKNDPLPHYYRTLVGWLYRHRLNQGLRSLPERCESILEIGYGSGILLPTLARHCQELVAVDLHPRHADVEAALRKLNVSAHLLSCDATHLPFPEGKFDVIVAFSLLEHVKPVHPFLEEFYRVLKRGGILILGMPMLNRAFNALFPLIGFKGIEDHHVTTAKEVRQTLSAAGFRFRHFGTPPWVPIAWRIYTIFEIRKPAVSSAGT